MNRIASFEKVSFDIFRDACISNTDLKPEEIKEAYENIVLPKRATTGSAGYDFYTPLPFMLKPGESIGIPTGIRVKMQADYVLMLFPRSGLGFKFRMQLDNTVGIIDSDYYNSDNEGHIIIKITNDTKDNKILNIESGKGFAQGIFLQYGITVDDDVTQMRNGGFGSTDGRRN